MGKHSCGNLLGAIGSAKAKAEDVPREKNEERKAAADKRKRKAAADELKEAKRLKKDAKAAEQAAKKSEAAAKKAEAESKAWVWKKTDPLKFPAYMFTKSIFKANNPLIQVICGDTHMPTFNKFSTQLRTKPSIRRAALLKCSKEICRSFSLYEDPNYEEFKSSLFRQLHHFTVPSAEALKRLENDQELFESLTGQKRKRIDRADLSGLSDQGDLIMEVGTRISWSLNEDMAIHVESRPLDEDGEEEGLMYADKKLYVRDASKDNLTNLELGDKKLVVVGEEKHKNKESASYQGGQSAVAEIAANIIKRHTSPVYVLSLAEKWKYAILHIRGMLELKNGAIDPASLPEFREQEKAMGFADDPIPDAELRSMLEMRTKYYQSRFSDSPTSVYPDGLYPVGKYYVSDKWRTLPLDAIGGCVNPDMQLFYEGLLRILIGDRVINWGDEELQRVQKVRKMMRKEELELRT